MNYIHLPERLRTNQRPAIAMALSLLSTDLPKHITQWLYLNMIEKAVLTSTVYLYYCDYLRKTMTIGMMNMLPMK